MTSTKIFICVPKQHFFLAKLQPGNKEDYNGQGKQQIQTKKRGGGGEIVRQSLLKQGDGSGQA
jgi:hypothetical protein